jgi:hypothetical protein
VFWITSGVKKVLLLVMPNLPVKNNNNKTAVKITLAMQCILPNTKAKKKKKKIQTKKAEM